MSEVSIEEFEQSATQTKHPVLFKSALRLLWSLIILALIGLVYYQATRDDVLPINEITFSGDFQRLSERDLKPVIENGVEGNFFTLSVASLYSSLVALPWVERVWIHRVWPDRININLLEQRPVAILNDRGVLNKNGEVFLNESEEFKGKLPVFIVPRQYEKEIIKVYERYSSLLEKYEMKISRFEYDNRKAQTIFLTNGMELKLGKEKTAQRLTRFLKVYDSELHQNTKKIKRVDLRYTNGFAVKWL